LPGELSLARRFHVNAKTLSKALTDLAAEGLLDRSIGRGTYVKDENSPAAPVKPGRWLVVCEPERADSAVLRYFKEANPDIVVMHDFEAMRPSFLKSFDRVVDLGISTPESFLRGLVVRNIPVVEVNREPNLYSIHHVGTDRALGASSLARDLILGGHSHIAVIESRPRSVVGRAVKQAVNRYGPEAMVQVISGEKVVEAIAAGATAVICDAASCARSVRASLEAAGLRVPQDVSLAAVGCCNDVYPCSGQYVESKLVAQTVVELLTGNNNGHRPVTIWLAPKWMDCGTTCNLPSRASAGGEAA
jgi:DNA-binding LacI/PurR family transcriptional regulator